MQLHVFHVNAFTDRLFSGNPASVCILGDWLPEAQLQSIASENALPVTAFLVRKLDGFHIRWFTTEYELDLCGHGTLAAAHIILHVMEPHSSHLEFRYPGGVLHVRNSEGWIVLEFPAKEIEELPSLDMLANGVGITPTSVYQYKAERCLAVFDSEDEIRKLEPDMRILKDMDHRGLVVTAPSKHYDFVSRTFYPRKKDFEDAVTGASHCLLIPYWAKRLNKSTLRAFQASARGGELLCEYLQEKVLISGKAIVYAEGRIRI